MTLHILITIIISILFIASFFLITFNTIGSDRIEGLSEYFKSTENTPFKISIYFSIILIIIANIFWVISLRPYTPEIIKINYIPPKFGFLLKRPEYLLPPYEYGFTGRLEALPQGIEFPKSFSYDANKKLLIFKGTVLTEEEKNELLKLSEDIEYRKTVEAIFEKSQKTRLPPSLGLFLSRICRYIGFAAFFNIAFFCLVLLSRRFTRFVIDRLSSSFYVEVGVLAFVIGVILSIINDFLE